MSKLKPYAQQVLDLMKDHGTTFDRIQAHYLYGDVLELSDKETAILRRWERCFELLTSFYSASQAVPMLMREFGISRPQAYRDISSSLKLYGAANRAEKAGQAAVLEEFAKRTLQLAASQTPPDIAGMNAALKNLYLAWGLNKSANEGQNDDFEAHRYVFQLVVNKGTERETIDIDFTDLKENRMRIVEAVEAMEVPKEHIQQLLDEADDD